ncbi:hypothetical protein HPULCUR_011139 [Helicostylum pulchrum]|uniref:DDE Tnp4 domain-containing protein n=1 Tax=Helicostylum pulchrum TaxID=562976 RepID=A0ABP9YFA9_9FUNG
MAFPNSGAISPLEVDPASHFTDEEEYLLTGSAHTTSIHTVPMFEERGGDSRFQSLKALRLLISNRKAVSRVDKWIQTCCILHNFLIDSNEEIDESWTTSSTTDDESSVHSVDFLPLLQGRMTVNETRPLRDAINGSEKEAILKRVLRESDWI